MNEHLFQIRNALITFFLASVIYSPVNFYFDANLAFNPLPIIIALGITAFLTDFGLIKSNSLTLKQLLCASLAAPFWVLLRSFALKSLQR